MSLTRTKGQDLHIAIAYNDDRLAYHGTAEELIALQYTVETAQTILQTLQSLGYSAITIGALGNSTERFRQELGRFSPENTFIFNTCDAMAGHSLGAATLVGIIEELGFRHTGASAEVVELCTRKELAKQKLLEHGLPTPAYQVLSAPQGDIQIRYPIIIKPLNEDGSLGIDLQSVVTTPDELYRRAKHVIEQYDQPALLEEFIAGREFAISIWGNETIEILPITEEDYCDIPDRLQRLCTYESKWQPESFYYNNIYVRCPANLAPQDQACLESTARQLYRALGLRDFARVDIRYEQGIPYIIDVNETPDLSIDSGFPRAAAEAGYSYPEMIEHMLGLALRREGWR